MAHMVVYYHLTISYVLQVVTQLEPFPGRFDGPRNSRRRQRLWRRDSTRTEGWKRFVLFVQTKCNFKDKSLFVFFAQVPCNTVLLFRIGNTVLCRFMFFLRHLSMF